MQSMVEGARGNAARNDPSKHSIQIAEHVTRSDPQHFKTVPAKQRISRRVTSWLITPTMTLSIHFDDQAPLQTGEIDRNLRHRKLPTELQSTRTCAKHLPEQDFGQTHIPPQLASASHLLDRSLEDAWDPSTALRAVPLPVPGRI